GGQALRLDVVRVPAEQTLAEYLTSGWIENIDPATVEEATINGFPGATAAAKGDQWDFRLYAVRFGSDVYRFIYAAKHRTPETDRIFRESIGTFRRMSLAEIEDAKPLRLQVVTVGPGDTVDKPASRMVVADRQVERFRVLNGLEPGDRLKSGSEVKIVVEWPLRHCEPRGPARSGRPDDKLREAIQRNDAEYWIASSLRSSQ